MSISHPIPSVNELGFEVERRSIVETRHFRISMSDRPNLDEDTVLDFVEEGWDDALYMHYLGSDGVSERYNVIFDKSNKYFLMIGIGIRDTEVDLVTAFKVNKHRGSPEDLVKQWG